MNTVPLPARAGQFFEVVYKNTEEAVRMCDSVTPSFSWWVTNHSAEYALLNHLTGTDMHIFSFIFILLPSTYAGPSTPSRSRYSVLVLSIYSPTLQKRQTKFDSP